MNTLIIPCARVLDAVMAADAVVHTLNDGDAPVGSHLAPAILRLLPQAVQAVAAAIDGVTATTGPVETDRGPEEAITIQWRAGAPEDACGRIEAVLTWKMLQMLYTGVDNERADRCGETASALALALSVHGADGERQPSWW